ncbi:hypothetical protein MPTK1_3g25130 [Marchantia polymorpha subsp. ruderalis]|nr:hypothetical protein MARPO_0100s0026 [Marchantia polymorpha]BBN06935.1 hypothetical protein Mp_3g25130 [Marchantia polymorpha subsp. ruderalis]|eukprot:PTQ32313.1 hypothetical protein MARPO_0100s0026 [Marchantia polymorpha]
MATGRVTICIGDIHGHVEKLERLWRNLELRLGAEEFGGCTVIFLGDYNDRGHQPRGVIDFLISLRKAYPQQKQVFLCGNHDFAFMACLGILPRPPAGFSYSSTWTKYLQNEKMEGWWQGEGQDDIHLQGRRWAGNIGIRMNPAKGILYKGSTYDAAVTFESYGVAHGDRAGLIAAVPEHHKQFLRNLSWVHEEDGAGETGDPATSYSRIIAVHAGLESTKSVEDQLRPLLEKDSTIARLEPLYGRKNVLKIPQELADERVMLVSGHHGCLILDGLRLIIDEGGGMPNNPIAAVILPSRIIVRDTDAPISPAPTISSSVTPALV